MSPKTKKPVAKRCVTKRELQPPTINPQSAHFPALGPVVRLAQTRFCDFCKNGPPKQIATPLSPRLPFQSTRPHLSSCLLAQTNCAQCWKVSANCETRPVIQRPGKSVSHDCTVKAESHLPCAYQPCRLHRSPGFAPSSLQASCSVTPPSSSMEVLLLIGVHWLALPLWIPSQRRLINCLPFPRIPPFFFLISPSAGEHLALQ